MYNNYFSNSANCDKIIVISDTHLGIDDSFSWISKNRERLVSFLNDVPKIPNVKEFVINGDLFDEWILPAQYPIYTDSNEFFRLVAKNNQEVVDSINKIIQTGKIKVTYIPGNHDMLFNKETVDEIFPGINQARDVLGLGKYRTGYNNNIIIEHGHRYDIINAPNQVSNKFITGNYPSILPQGYLITRIATTSVVEGYLTFSEPDCCDIDQHDAYLYYKACDASFGVLPLNEGFDKKEFPITINGYNGYYSLADMLPSMKNGEITAYLYPNFQRDWEAIQKINNVKVPIPFCKEMIGIAQETSICHKGCETINDVVDDQACAQYFNLNDCIDIVIFGHTHRAEKIIYNCNGKNKIYVNSGTWIYGNTDGTTCNFVVINECKDFSSVDVYIYEEDKTITKISPKKKYSC
ncbi:MAG: metallophosphoesterase [Clostridioides sp.]|jgi:UDP-2,3-diacylglucosamine pyrophosphatase LpxH|nr:metallophosphoesterase [Clostridioides sp.]